MTTQQTTCRTQITKTTKPHISTPLKRGTPQTQLTNKNRFSPANQENVMVGLERFELSTFRLSAERSSQTELQAHRHTIK